jgi:hypothetical protein
MSCTSGSTFQLSAANVSWGRREISSVEFTQNAVALEGLYFLIDAPASNFAASTGYYVWFDLDATPTDPMVVGRTGIEVDVVTGDTAAQVAAKVEAVLEAHASFRAIICEDAPTVVQIESEFKGPVANIVDEGNTACVVARILEGLGGDLGKTSGGVEVAMEATSVQILADQTGGLVQDEVFTGSTVEVTMSLLEMTPARWETVVGSVTGDTFTPMGGTQLVGYGESRLYSSFFDLGGELVLHPTRFAASDRSRDITLWKSVPKPASINFSGEEPQVMEVTFTALADRGIEAAINLMAFGDSEQDVRI